MPVKVKLWEAMVNREIRTIAEMSKKSGLSRKSVSKLLNHQTTRLDLNVLYKLCKALDCEVGELVVYEKKEEGA